MFRKYNNQIVYISSVGFSVHFTASMKHPTRGSHYNIKTLSPNLIYYFCIHLIQEAGLIIVEDIIP